MGANKPKGINMLIKIGKNYKLEYQSEIKKKEKKRLDEKYVIGFL